MGNVRGQVQVEQGGGIEIFAAPANGEMKMRSGGATGGAAQSELFPAIDMVAFFDRELGEVQVQTQKTLAVIDDHAISFEVKGLG